jgi:DNA-binding response OmpR family regulator
MRRSAEGVYERPLRRAGLMSRRALIVDDDPSLAELFREAVGSSGVDVLTQTRCDAAASCLSKEKFDVVLLGLHMPALDGIDLTRQIRSAGINRMTPIIVVSDDQQSSAVALAFEAGASFFLYKPVDKARLLKLIRATQGSIENERRRFRRVPCHVKVRLATEAGELHGETLDISLDGILVRASSSLPDKTNVRVALYLQGDAKPVLAVGSVTRSIGVDLMGIHLDRMSAAESARLQDFLLPLIADATTMLERAPVSM